MIARRTLLGSAAAAVLVPLLWGTPLLAAARAIPQQVSARVIVDNDFAGDPDALIALAHHLLTPKTRVVLVTVSALDSQLPGNGTLDRSAAEGRQTALELVALARADQPPVIAGSELLGRSDLPPSAAARAIVAEAMRTDPLPLFFACGGPLTNLAAALRLEPAIARRMTVVWIGGGTYPAGGWEYNLSADRAAGRRVIEASVVPFWQVPQGAYRQMQYSVAALGEELRPLSPLGAWLYDRFTTPPSFVDVGGSWPLGDSPTALLTSVSIESSSYADQLARRINDDLTYGTPIPGRTIRVFDRLDARLAFDDFFALLRRQARNGQAVRTGS